jgi:hypothetical protein
MRDPLSRARERQFGSVMLLIGNILELPELHALVRTIALIM